MVQPALLISLGSLVTLPVYHDREMINTSLFHDGGRYHIETSPLSGANQWTGFYMITTSVMKELMLFAD